ncbi:hypothetical protein E2C01_065068 [Portunus trituberculatus]|uniref:Uncharacterized protein n=1 Tax=Portunus trituberculatus TaxID=210409 RepID=A0A5B7HM10_PORTR|nr:hypothetical protein [Portunus trituberculatus]
MKEGGRGFGMAAILSTASVDVEKSADRVGASALRWGLMEGEKEEEGGGEAGVGGGEGGGRL